MAGIETQGNPHVIPVASLADIRHQLPSVERPIDPALFLDIDGTYATGLANIYRVYLPTFGKKYRQRIAERKAQLGLLLDALNPDELHIWSSRVRRGINPMPKRLRREFEEVVAAYQERSGRRIETTHILGWDKNRLMRPFFGKQKKLQGALDRIAEGRTAVFAGNGGDDRVGATKSAEGRRTVFFKVGEPKTPRSSRRRPR